MGVGMCSTGQHVLWISVGGFRSFPPCDCPPWPLPDGPIWRDVKPVRRQPKKGSPWVKHA